MKARVKMAVNGPACGLRLPVRVAPRAPGNGYLEP